MVKEVTKWYCYFVRVHIIHISSKYLQDRWGPLHQNIRNIGHERKRDTFVREVSGPEVDDVSRLEVGEGRGEMWAIYRIALEHIRLLPNFVERCRCGLTFYDVSDRHTQSSKSFLDGVEHPATDPAISSGFDVGGSRTDMVFQSGSPSGGHIFLTDLNCWRLA